MPRARCVLLSESAQCSALPTPEHDAMTTLQNPTSNQTPSNCGCAQSGCGCGPVTACTCGAACACQRECRCGAGCNCAQAR